MLWSLNASKNLFSSGPPLPKGKVFFCNLIICPIINETWSSPYEVKQIYVQFVRLYVKYFQKTRRQVPPHPPYEVKNTFHLYVYFSQVPPYQVTHTFNLYLYIRYIFKSKKKCIPLEISEKKENIKVFCICCGFSRLKFLHCQRLILETLLHTRQWCVCVCRSSLTFGYR